MGLGPWPDVREEGLRASLSSSASRKGNGESEELSLSFPRLKVAELPKGIGVSRGPFPKEEKVEVCELWEGGICLSACGSWVTRKDGGRAKMLVSGRLTATSLTTRGSSSSSTVPWKGVWPLKKVLGLKLSSVKPLMSGNAVEASGASCKTVKNEDGGAVVWELE